MQGPVSPATVTNHDQEVDFPRDLTSQSRNPMDLSQYEWLDMGCMLSHVFCQMGGWLGDTTDTCGCTVGEQLQ